MRRANRPAGPGVAVTGAVLFPPVRLGQVWITHASSLVGGHGGRERAAIRQENTLPGDTYYPGTYCVTLALRKQRHLHAGNAAYLLTLARRPRRVVGSPVPSTYEVARWFQAQLWQTSTT